MALNETILIENARWASRNLKLKSSPKNDDAET